MPYPHLIESPAGKHRESGATDGTRTRDNLNHNQGL